MRHADTIVAPITPPGVGAVASVRISGPEAFSIAREIFDGLPASPVTHHAYYGHFTHGDEGLMLVFQDGHGYTGEPAVEAMIHGSPASVRLLVEAALGAGARMAEPGEFTLRAFLNGTMDLSQAEAVRDTVEAQTDLQLRFANAQRSGALRSSVRAMRAQLLAALAAVEAHVDFEEELGPLDRGMVRDVADHVAREIEGWLSTERAGQIVRHGLRIALIGEPNAGKSSLLNALLGRDRAIVTPIAGTTRDTIEESVILGGIPCVLIDTAGLRETDDPIEVLGVARAQAAAANADAVWYLHDATRTPTPTPDCDLLLLTKADLVSPDAHVESGLSISAVTGQGLNRLHAWVAAQAEVAPDWACLIDARHAPLLRLALTGLNLVESTIEHDLPDDLLSVGLREAHAHLGEIIGENAAADMLTSIFSSFCIGK
jgi:tRNA modification GTPase